MHLLKIRFTCWESNFSIFWRFLLNKNFVTLRFTFNILLLYLSVQSVALNVIPTKKNQGCLQTRLIPGLREEMYKIPCHTRKQRNSQRLPEACQQKSGRNLRWLPLAKEGTIWTFLKYAFYYSYWGPKNLLGILKSKAVLSLTTVKLLIWNWELLTFSKPHSQNDFISYIKQKWTGDWIASKNAIK